MTSPTARLPLGSGDLEVSLDSQVEWDWLTPRLDGDEGSALEDLPAFDTTLSDIASREAIAAARARVVVAVPDRTRPAPVGEFLGRLIPALERVGVSRGRILVLVATGTHASPPAKELAARWPVPEGVEVRVHDCDAPGKSFPKTAAGTPVELDPSYVEAELKIVLAPVSFHYFAGFGGGPKMIFPGLASRAGALANHRLSLAALPPGGVAEGCAPGRVDQNPVALDLAEAAGRCPPHWELHAVLSAQGWRVFPGPSGLEEARRAVTRKGSVGEARAYDVVVASAGGAPKDIDLVQSHKGLNHAARYARAGAPIVYFAAIPQGAGSSSFERWLAIADPDSLEREARAAYQLNAQTAISLRSLCRKHPIYWVGAERPEWVERAGARVRRDAALALREALAGREGTRGALLPSAAEIVPHPLLRTGALSQASGTVSSA